ncbi:MAG: ATP-binding protein [Candidatus Competibacter sp.]
MKANPGGAVSPENVMGRDRLIERLWVTLKHQSLVLVAERRMGKTCIIKKMEARPPDGTMIRVRDVGGVSSPIEFVERVAEDVEKHLNLFQKTATKTKELWAALGGTQILGVKLPTTAAPHWKALLERILGDLAQHSDRPVILCWDELPWMLQKIARSEGETVVMDLLDTLRGLRQTHTNLRMIYTGSIGLHHVVTALREEGYVNSPVNDMRTVEVPPLDDGHAEALAKALIQGEGLTSSALDETAAIIARRVDAIPFYIHHMVAAMADRGQAATPEIAETIVAEALANAQDWDLEHFRSRLVTYYGERAEVVRALLDQLAETEPLTLDELHERLKINLSRLGTNAQRMVEGDREALRTLLKLMQRDHYLHQDRDGGYRFRFSLIRRWWRLDQGLA